MAGFVSCVVYVENGSTKSAWTMRKLRRLKGTEGKHKDSVRIILDEGNVYFEKTIETFQMFERKESLPAKKKKGWC